MIAWKRINDENLLGPFERDVYNILYAHGPLTAGEVSRYYAAKYPGTHRARNENAKIVYTLKQRGVVFEVGEEIKCPVTGHIAMLFDVNDRLPVKAPKSDKFKCPTCKGSGHIEQGRLF